MTQFLDSTSGWRTWVSSRREAVAAFGLAALFLGLNLALGGRSPTVWLDEVQCVDLSVSLLEHGSPTTRTMGFMGPDGTRTADVPYFANWPIRIALLAGWLSVVPLTPGWVRAYGYLIVTVVALLGWLFLGKSQPSLSPWLRVAFIPLALCGYGISFSYRGGRYDVEGMLVVVLLWGASLGAGTWSSRRLLVAGLLGALLPWVGLQTLPYVALLSLVALVQHRRRSVPFLTAVSFGVALGLALLVALYWTVGSVQLQFNATQHHLPAGSPSVVSRLANALPSRAYLQDHSSNVLVGALAVCALANRLVGCPLKGSFVWPALAMFVGVPATLLLSGRYPVYYTWMAYGPLAVLTLLEFNRIDALQEAHDRPLRRRVFRGFMLLSLFVACGLGLPARACVTALTWSQRDHAPVVSFLQTEVRPSDVALSDVSAYYAVRPLARLSYFEPFLGALRPEEAEQLTVVVVRPEQARSILTRLPGAWTRVTSFPAPADAHDQPSAAGALPVRVARSYAFEVYRRSP